MATSLIPWVPGDAGVVSLEIPPGTSRLKWLRGPSELRASSDVEAMKAWLSRYLDSPSTLSNYRTEVERFYLWIRGCGLALSDVTFEDLISFREFLRKPPATWVNATSRPRRDPAWRPLRGPLSERSISHAESVLRSMFAWLAAAHWVPSDPYVLMKPIKVATQSRVTRYLNRAQWQDVLKAVERQPRENADDAVRYARDRWMMRLIYGTGMRISEAAGHTMAALSVRDTPRGERYSLQIVGKGRKAREIPVGAALLSELRAYRVALGLTPLPDDPEVDANTPLVASTRGDGPLSRYGLHHAVVAILLAAAAWADGQGRARDAKALRDASTHWLRHSRASHLLDRGVGVKNVQAILGHSNLATTSRYVHTELDTMQEEVERADANSD